MCIECKLCSGQPYLLDCSAMHNRKSGISISKQMNIYILRLANSSFKNEFYLLA